MTMRTKILGDTIMHGTLLDPLMVPSHVRQRLNGLQVKITRQHLRTLRVSALSSTDDDRILLVKAKRLRSMLRTLGTK